MRDVLGMMLVGIVLSACAELRAELTGEAQPTEEPTLEITVVGEEPPLPTPTLRPTVLPTMEPIASGKYVQALGWSADSQWAAFLMRQMDGDSIELYFYQAASGEVCGVPNFTLAQPEDLREFVLASEWQADGRFILQDAAGFHVGMPCEGEFVLTDQGFVQEDASLASEVSPDGTHRAVTQSSDEGQAAFKVRVTITDTATGEALQVIEFTHHAGLGTYLRGGEWVSDNEFLVWETLDRGPLLVDVAAGTTTELLADVFRVETPDDDDLSYYVDAVVSDGSYHLLLIASSGFDSKFPDIQLYHPETGEVESLGYKALWGYGDFIAPDGAWLLLDSQPNVTSEDGAYEFGTGGLVARQIDPPGSEAHFIAQGEGSEWSPQGDLLALSAVGLGNYVSLYSFPTGDLLMVWEAGVYTPIPDSWSPDGHYLLMMGYVPEKEEQALFVVEP